MSEKKIILLSVASLLLLTGNACSKNIIEPTITEFTNENTAELETKEEGVVEDKTEEGRKYFAVSYFKENNEIFYFFRENNFKVEGADVETFESLGHNYSKDKNNVYNRYSILVEADVETFEFLETKDYGKLDYAKDKNNIYLGNQAIEGADLTTFEIVDKDYAKDKNTMYYRGKPTRVDAGSFERVDDKYVKDKNQVFYNNKFITYSDPDTFELLGGAYAKDKNKIYFIGKIMLPNYLDTEYIVDIESFELLEDGFAKDKNNYYRYGKIVEDYGA